MNLGQTEITIIASVLAILATLVTGVWVIVRILVKNEKEHGDFREGLTKITGQVGVNFAEIQGSTNTAMIQVQSTLSQKILEVQGTLSEQIMKTRAELNRAIDEIGVDIRALREAQRIEQEK